MIRYHFDLYPRDDPKDGARLQRFTRLQSAEYRGEANGTGAGKFTIRASDEEVDAIAREGQQYIRVVREDTVAETEAVVGGFWLDQGDVSILDESMTQLLTYGGAGTLSYLDRAVMWSYAYVTDERPPDGVWDFAQMFGDFTLGQVLRKVLAEAQLFNNPSESADDRTSNALPDLSLTFSTTQDSDGNAWTIPAGDFTAQVGESVLQVVKRLMEAGLYIEMDPDTFEVNAWEAANHGRDRTGTAFASDVVLFKSQGTQAGSNILAQLTRGIDARRRLSVLLTGSNGLYADSRQVTGVEREGFYEYDSDDRSILEEIGDAQIDAFNDSSDSARLRFKLGDDPANGYYLPLESTGVLLDDSVTLDTLALNTFNYSDATFPVAALTLKVKPGGDWEAWADIGTSFQSMSDRAFQAQPVRKHRHPPNPRLCPALIPGEETATRLYFGADADTISPAASAVWDHADVGELDDLLITTADGSRTGSGADRSSTDGGAGVDVRLGQFLFPMDAGLAAIIAAGGATVRMQARTKSRHGVGISEAAQDNISQIVIRVTQGESTTIRGTAYAGHSLASSAGSAKWAAQSTLVNRVFPPAAADNELTAVANTAAGDRLVVEFGYRSFTVGSTGGGINFCNAGASDLPEDETETDNLNAWIEIRSITAPIGSGNNPDLVGTSTRAARCDHKHHVVRERTPGVDDDSSQGYPVGTFWVYVDDEETPTEILTTYLLVDNTEGAAVWVLQAGTGSSSEEHEHDPPEIVSTVVDHGAMGATETFDHADGTDHEGTLDENLTVTLGSTTSGEAAFLTLVLTQDATGTNTLTLPASVVNADDIEAAFDTAANAVNILTLFTYDGGVTWYGFLAGGSGDSSTSWIVDPGAPSYSGSGPVTVALTSVFGIDSSGNPYYNAANVTDGEEAALVWDSITGTYSLRPYYP